MKLIVKMKTDMKMKMVLTIGHIKYFLADATLNIVRRKKGDDDKYKCKYFIKIMDFFSLVQQFSGVSVIRAYVVKIFDEVTILTVSSTVSSAVSSTLSSTVSSTVPSSPLSLA